MEQDHGDSVSRSHNIVYTLPPSLKALGSVISPQIERLDPEVDRLQLLILTPDTESTLSVAELARKTAKPSLTIFPVTSAQRTARLIASRKPHGLVGTVHEIQALIAQSAIKLGELNLLVVAWADEIISPDADKEASATVDSIISEIPKDATRILTATELNEAIEQLIERFWWKARRITDTKPAGRPKYDAPELNLQFTTVSDTSRPVMLQRVLDAINPPSAQVVTTSEAASEAVSDALTQLGYTDEDDPVQLAGKAIPVGTHTVIFYEAPLTREELESAAEAQPVNVVVLANPRELQRLKKLADTLVPITPPKSTIAARRRERYLRGELSAIIDTGVAFSNVLLIEPLLDQYEPVEIAAAAIQLMEAERQKAIAEQAAARASAPRGEPRGDRGFNRGSDREREGGRGDFRGGREGGFRGPREGGFRGPREGGFGGRGSDRRPSSDRGRERFGGDRDRKFDRGPRSDRRFGGGEGGRDRGGSEGRGRGGPSGREDRDRQRRD